MRTQAHIVDTKAIKVVMAHLPDHWVVRELSERDYGIDLMVEIFAPGLKDAKGKDAFDATGAVFHIQIKGVDEELQPVRAGTINYCVEKKSLAYVEKFNTPFFLFRVSIAEPPTIYFLWIQRYVKDVMDRETPMWRDNSEKSITIRIPLSNELSIGLKKIEEIAFRPKYIEELAEFSEIYEDIGGRIQGIREGLHKIDEDVIADLKNRAYRIRRMNVLLNRNHCCIDKQSVDALIQHIIALDSSEGCRQPIPEAANFEMLAKSISNIDFVENFTLENDGLVAY